MGRLVRALIAVSTASLLTGCAAGPALFGSQTGTVAGHVIIRSCGGAYRMDQNGCRVAPAEGVAVMFSKGSAQPATAITDASGRYHIDLAPGSYTVSAAYITAGLAHPSGFSPRLSGPAAVTVSAGKTVTVDFTGTVELL